MRFPPRPQAAPPVIVQWVRTAWTTASRGGPGAVRRANRPVVFPLPLEEFTTHRVDMDERDGFRPRHVLSGELPGDDVMEIRREDGAIRVRLARNAWWNPPRRGGPPAVRLRPGEWLRWSVNTRWVGERVWTYHLDTFNVGHAVKGEFAFLGTPVRTVDETVRL